MQKTHPDVKTINPADLDLADLRWLAMLAEDAAYRRRHSPSRRRDALIARWEESREPRTCPACATTPTGWTPTHARQWLESLRMGDLRAWLAREAGIDLAQLDAALWWYRLSDRQRFDLEHVSYKAQRDERDQDERHRRRDHFRASLEKNVSARRSRV